MKTTTQKQRSIRSERRAERLAVVERMNADERVAAMYRGELGFDQLAHWAAQRPHEVPKLNGEFWFIAITCED